MVSDIQSKTSDRILPVSHDLKIWMINQSDLFEMIESQGKECYGEKFSLLEEDVELLRKLLIYFFSDWELTKRNNIDLKKGVMLAGPVGSGKTSIMALVSYFQSVQQRHILKPCRDIVLEFHSKGFKTINKYGKSFQKVEGSLLPVAYCFDDLGSESKVSYYGNDCDVIKEIILSRYDLFESIGMMTHFTTNLNVKELEVRYGENVISRLEAMTNFMAFDNTTKDKRRHK